MLHPRSIVVILATALGLAVLGGCVTERRPAPPPEALPVEVGKTWSLFSGAEPIGRLVELELQRDEQTLRWYRVETRDGQWVGYATSAGSFYRYLPFEANLWRGLGLLFAYGASPAAIEAEMERRAELAALAVSEHTELVLAHIVDFYGEPPQRSPHHIGFSQLLREMHGERRQLGVDEENAAPSRWHLVPRETLREAARRLLGELPSAP